MTLLEAIVACVVLSIAGVVCLEQAQGAARLEREALAWSRAVPEADAALAAAVVGGAGLVDDRVPSQAGEPAATRRPWRPGVEVLEVSVPVSTGGTMRVQRLVAAPRVRGR